VSKRMLGANPVGVRRVVPNAHGAIERENFDRAPLHEHSCVVKNVVLMLPTLMLPILGMLALSGCASRIKFVVTDCATKQPIAGAQLQVFVDSVEGGSSTTKSDGVAELAVAQGDSRQVSIFAKGYQEDHAIYGAAAVGRVDVCLSSAMP
jgi:hypothetical protein